MGIARCHLAACRGSLGNSGPCGSSGAVADNRGYQTLTKAPTNSAKPEYPQGESRLRWDDTRVDPMRDDSCVDKTRSVSSAHQNAKRSGDDFRRGWMSILEDENSGHSLYSWADRHGVPQKVIAENVSHAKEKLGE